MKILRGAMEETDESERRRAQTKIEESNCGHYLRHGVECHFVFTKIKGRSICLPDQRGSISRRQIVPVASSPGRPAARMRFEMLPRESRQEACVLRRFSDNSDDKTTPTPQSLPFTQAFLLFIKISSLTTPCCMYCGPGGFTAFELRDEKAGGLALNGYPMKVQQLPDRAGKKIE